MGKNLFLKFQFFAFDWSKLKSKIKGDKQLQKKIVLNYLIKENRPFSAQDVSNNLGGQIGKSAVATILEQLASDKKIIEKVYNKQKVYMALQVKIIATSFFSLFQTEIENKNNK